MAPHLVTALTGPLLDLEKKIMQATPAIERWFRLEWQEHTPPFYCSVDLRNAGYKLAPVDTNLFPGGFNNLATEMLPLSVQAAMAAIDKYCPDARNLLMIPEESHRHPGYMQNVARLMQIFRQTGLHVRLGSLSADIPSILENIHEQSLLPPVHAGWAVRRKTNHMNAYGEVAKKFGKLIDIDPWLVNPLHARCGEVDFEQAGGLECLSDNVSSLLAKIRKKYKEYGIKDQKPFVILKPDAGTYGMGILTIKDASELKDLSMAQRARMAVVKDGLRISDVIIQEGVPTFEHIKDAVAEPVVYMIDRYVVGGFYRVHAEKGVDQNLNAPGSEFVPLAFAQQHAVPDLKAKPGTAGPNRFYVYGVVARLGLLAASLEMERTDPNPEVY